MKKYFPRFQRMGRVFENIFIGRYLFIEMGVYLYCYQNQKRVMKNIIKNITEACTAQFEVAVQKEIESLKALYVAYTAAPDRYEFWTKHFGTCPSMMKKAMHDRYYAISRKMYMVANEGWELFSAAEKVTMVENLSGKLIEAVTKHCQAYTEISNIELDATEKGYAIKATLDNGKATLKTDCILVWGPIVSAHYRYTCKVK